MKVAVVGNLVNVGYLLTKFLRRKGVEADLYLHPDEADPAWEDADVDRSLIKTYGYRYLHHSFRPVKTSLYFADRLNLLRQLSRCDVVQKVCGGFGALELNYLRLSRTPYCTLATGSDLRELARQDSKEGRVTLSCFRQSRVLFLSTADLVKTATELGLTNWVYLPHLIDTRKYSPAEYGLGKSGFDAIYFMASRLDWSYTGPDRDVPTLKHNDRFIRAFARYIKEGHNSLAIIVDLGVDKEKARVLVHELGIDRNVEFVPTMPKNSLINYYNGADVVVDQFGAGWFGLVSLEAMSCARPVLAYINNEYSAAVYPEVPPVLNCQTEDEIYAQLIKAGDRNYREQVGRQAREWILKYHDGEKVIESVIARYRTILGQRD